jgi:hypothetical protein
MYYNFILLSESVSSQYLWRVFSQIFYFHLVLWRNN